MHLQVASQPRSVRVAYEIVLMWERSQSPAGLSTPGCNKAITNRGVAQATSVATTVEAQSLAPHHRSYAAPVTGEGNLQRAHRSQGSRTGELGPTSLKHGTGGRSSEEMAKYRDIVNVSPRGVRPTGPTYAHWICRYMRLTVFNPSIGMCHTTETFRVNQVDAHPKQVERDDIAAHRKNTSWNERARQEAE